MSRKKKIYEGKAKILFEGPETGTLIQYFKDDATAFNNEKKGEINGKGVINNRISEFLMQLIDGMGIPTHFIKRLNMREQLIRAVDIIQIEVIMRNKVAGSLAKRLGLAVGTKLDRTILEWSYKDDSLGDPLVTDEHILCFGWATHQELEDMASNAMRINDILCGVFAGVGLELIDCKLEFGRSYKDDTVKIVLADEISPDCCRLWDQKTGKKLDKDRFREDLGDIPEAYQEVARRLGLLT